MAFQKRQPVDIRLSRPLTAAILYAFFALAYLITPYWQTAPSLSAQLPWFAASAILGGIWCWCSSGEICLRISLRSAAVNLGLFTLLLTILTLLEARTLLLNLPWKGDESYHFEKILGLAQILTLRRWMFLLLLFAPFLLVVWRKPIWFVPAGVLFTATILGYFLKRTPFRDLDPSFLLRYPFIGYWPAAIAPWAMLSSGHHAPEALYRLTPLLFASALAFAIQRSLAGRSGMFGSLLWGLAVMTMPLVRYYAAIFYLEMPAIFLLTIACLNITHLLEDDPGDLKHLPAWYALILAGFMKETTLPFLAWFVACRWALRWLRCRPVKSLRWLWGEMGVSIAVLAPLGLYLVLHTFLVQSRGFGMQISGIDLASVFAVTGRALFEQTGLFWLLFLLGCAVLFHRRKTSALVFLLLAVAAVLLFHLLDDWNYSGYSRFNLMILPPILAGVVAFARWLSEQRRAFTFGTVGLVILASLLLTPIQPDGTRRPGWGVYIADIAEHDYPYRDAFAWLSDRPATDRVLLAGMTYPYYLDFYKLAFPGVLRFDPFDAPVGRSDASALASALAYADQNGQVQILFHVLGREAPQLPPGSSFRLEHIFFNQAHMLALYQSIEP